MVGWLHWFKLVTADFDQGFGRACANFEFDLDVSASVQVPKYDGDVFSEDGKKVVHEYHAQYMKVLQKLYDDHKNTYHAGRKSEMKFVG